MELNYFRPGKAVCAGNDFQVGAKLVAVADRNFHGFWFDGPPRIGTPLRVMHGCLDCGVIDQARIEGDQQGTVGGLQIA